MKRLVSRSRSQSHRSGMRLMHPPLLADSSEFAMASTNELQRVDEPRRGTQMPSSWQVRLDVHADSCARMSRWVSLLTAVVVVTGVSVGRTNCFASNANYLPDVTLTNQDSRAISLSSLRGEPVLVGFVHTMCKGVCQMMTSNMRSIASALPPASAAGVTMLLITTDPADDQPPQLLAYAKGQDLGGKKWLLVTGPKGSIKRVMRLYGVKHGDTDDSMTHVMKLFLIAPGGTLAHVYPGMQVSPQKVVSDIESLSNAHSAAMSESLGAAR